MFTKRTFFFLFTFFILRYFEAQKINVFDTLLSHHIFSHIEAEKKANYFLDENKNLKRKIFLSSETFHYHKPHEDSIYYFLKSTYGNSFNGLIFIAAENLNWETEKKQKFTWKKGEVLNKEKLDKVYASLLEINIHPRRNPYVQEEEQNHFFFYQNYLWDSTNKIIYCFNTLKGKRDGKIIYNELGEITSEVGYYRDGKIFYEYNQSVLSIFFKNGNKKYVIDESSIKAYNSNNELSYDFNKQTQTFSKNYSGKKIKDHHKEINALWREVYME